MDQQRVLDDVVAWATADANVRSVVVTGSFAAGTHDTLSDLDIELYVRDASLLLEETDWYHRFGDVLVVEALENPEWHPTRLVYYVDAKIDFMIAPTSALAGGINYDGPFIVALDKDGRGDRLEPMVGVPPPSAAEFRECMEWFYAAALQYAKGLRRDDPWPVKVRDAELKQQLLRMIEWDFGVRHGWAERPPHNGSRIARWADADVADAVARCWADLSIGASADALFYSMTLFDRVRKRVSSALGFADEVSVRATIEVQRLLAPSVP